MRSNGFVDIAIEVRGVHDLLVLVPQPTQQVNVTVRIEGVPGALTATPSQCDQSVIAEVKAIHGDEHGEVGPELVDDVLGDLGFARPGAPVIPRMCR